MTRQSMQLKNMTISETWRWRFLTAWVIIFTAISAYALVQVHTVADDNRDALCAIRSDRVNLYLALGVVAQKEGQKDVAKILQEATEGEQAALAVLEC